MEYIKLLGKNVEFKAGKALDEYGNDITSEYDNAVTMANIRKMPEKTIKFYHIGKLVYECYTTKAREVFFKLKDDKYSPMQKDDEVYIDPDMKLNGFFDGL